MSKNKIVKSTLLNIDSSFRDLYPKNICKSNNKILPNNPLSLYVGSNIININYPNHSLLIGDNIIIQNVEGIAHTLSNSFYLVNNFKYLVIFIDDNQIKSNYKLYNKNLNVNIELIQMQGFGLPSMFNNIPINSFLGIKQILLSNDISESNIILIQNLVISLTGAYSSDILLKQFIFIELPYEYINNINEYVNIDYVFKISYLHIGGIALGYLNSNYPINNYNYQSSYSVYNVVDENNIQILLNFNSYGNINGGGSYIQIMKILNSITGYPDADTYVINLKKSFNNVINIELISSEFPYVDIIIKKDVNDKLYWKNINDGDNVYKVVIDEGFYSTDTLLNKLKLQINQVPKLSYSTVNQDYNMFDIELESNTQKISFIPYNLSKLPNSLSAHLELIDSVLYYILTITHIDPSNMVEVNDNITISNAEAVTVKVETNDTLQYFLINANYINKLHKVYLVNLKNQTYNVILGKQKEVTTTTQTQILNGGENILIKTKTKVSFLFNKSDTLGAILGFKNIGDQYSITQFDSIITNKDSYLNSNNLNSVGNIISYSSGFINLSGTYNYILMYLNDIEYIYNSNNLPAAFAKILLSGNPGDILFNTFVTQPKNSYSKSFPISSLTSISVNFIYPDGTPINFRNINHSFTLKITEELQQNSNTNLNSNMISVIDEFKNAFVE